MDAAALTLPAFVALAAACAPDVAPETLADVARAESGFRPLAIRVNGPGGGPLHPRSLAEAVAAARLLVAAGRSADFGLGQINSRNLRWLGLTPETVFDPCRNVAASAAVLTAHSRYNTGTPTGGLANGYVARVLAAGRANDGEAARAAGAPSSPMAAAEAAPSPSAAAVIARRAAWRQLTTGITTAAPLPAPPGQER